MSEYSLRSLMQDPYNSMLFASLRFAALTVLLSSCNPTLPVQREPEQAGEGALAYSIVCVIHGDGDYLYHDTSGNEYKADAEALAGAKMVGRENPHAEVFIFHQRPRRHFLFVFPLHDGEFYYYRNGRLIANELYWRDERIHYDTEVGLYRRFRTNNQRELLSVFLYCGHEIPEFGRAGYDASYPDRKFTVQDFARGLQGFTGPSGKFDIMVLSTCFGGTPYTIGALGPFSRYIIASPDNLHLSYFGLHPLERLDLGVQDGNVPAFAKSFAHQAFDRLTGDIQTAVSVTVYDVDRVQEYIHSVQKVYDVTMGTLEGEAQTSTATIEHCDCADLPPYQLPTMNKGVEVLYRPARFGRSKDKKNHSGWECWREKGPQTAASQTTEPVLK